ncbi:MAG: glycosyltransferase family 2 protein [Flavobacteriales bacterium]|nr:glycosyltransferase family 2 protein [Flavobacteriales bacterium]
MGSSVAIVIPCLNEKAYIGRCIESILDQDYAEGSIDVFIADGMSDDGTREIIGSYSKEHPNVHLVDNPIKHTPVALNLGIKASTSDVVIILGAHAELYENFVSKNIEALEVHPDAGCVGGVIENVNENETAAIIGRAMASPFGVGNARFRTGGKAAYVDTVAFGAYRKEVFEQIGLFDEELVRNQDDEFNYRLTSSGSKVWFDPKIRSKYYVRSSYSKLFKQYRQYGYWKVYVNKKHGAVTSIRQLIPFFFVAFLMVGSLLSIFFPLARNAFGFGLVLWFIGAMIGALWAQSRSAQIGGVIASFFLLHVSYGLGYAKGLLDFLILGRKPARSGYRTTR